MNQWIFERHELQATPSIVDDDMSVVEETLCRVRGCSFIQTVGCRLGMTQLPITTATVYFHRFYARRSFKKFQFEYVAAVCLFLAGKVQESSRKLHDVISMCVTNKYEKPTPEEENRLFSTWREEVLLHEQILLETLCFDLTIETPHQFLYELGNDIQAPDVVMYTAVAFANDSTRLPLCLMYQPNLVAIACLLLGYRSANLDFPEDEEGSEWTILLQDHFKTITAIITDITSVYQYAHRQ